MLGVGLSMASLLAVAKSHTDNDISYAAEFMSEVPTRTSTSTLRGYNRLNVVQAVGSSPYIEKTGEIKLMTVLQAMRTVLDSCSSLRVSGLAVRRGAGAGLVLVEVCEAALNIVHLLVDMGILDEEPPPAAPKTPPSNSSPIAAPTPDAAPAPAAQPQEDRDPNKLDAFALVAACAVRFASP